MGLKAQLGERKVPIFVDFFLSWVKDHAGGPRCYIVIATELNSMVGGSMGSKGYSSPDKCLVRSM